MNPERSLPISVAIVGSILVIAMFTVMTVFFIQNARDRQMSAKVQFSGCVANNDRASVVIKSYQMLKQAEMNNSISGLAEVKRMRLEAYDLLIVEMKKIVRNCEALYPGVAYHVY